MPGWTSEWDERWTEKGERHWYRRDFWNSDDESEPTKHPFDDGSGVIYSIDPIEEYPLPARGEDCPDLTTSEWRALRGEKFRDAGRAKRNAEAKVIAWFVEREALR